MPRKREEDDFKLQVIHLAQLNGWLVAHHPDSRHLQGDAGLPDLIMARGGQVVMAELKSTAGVLSEAQEGWIAALGGERGYLSDTLIVRVWRPSDLDGDVLEILNA